MKKIATIAIIVGFVLLLAEPAYAKILPQARGGNTTRVTSTKAGSGITVSPRLRGDRKALIVSFGNLRNASNISYQLVYNANGEQEGAGGTLAAEENSVTRELLFGTCSRDVCTYHRNITNMRLEVSYNSAGKKYVKRFRIRV